MGKGAEDATMVRDLLPDRYMVDIADGPQV